MATPHDFDSSPNSRRNVYFLAETPLKASSRTGQLTCLPSIYSSLSGSCTLLLTIMELLLEI